MLEREGFREMKENVKGEGIYTPPYSHRSNVFLPIPLLYTLASPGADLNMVAPDAFTP